MTPQYLKNTDNREKRREEKETHRGLWRDRERVRHQNLSDVVLDVEGCGLFCCVLQFDLLECTLPDWSCEFYGLDGSSLYELILKLVPLVFSSLVIGKHNLQSIRTCLEKEIIITGIKEEINLLQVKILPLEAELFLCKRRHLACNPWCHWLGRR